MNKKIKKRLDESQGEQNKYPGNNKASPQIENGYTRIANELLEAMAKLNLSPTEWKILMVIIRNTYGYHKKEAHIKRADFALATGVRETNISRGVSRLIRMKVCIRTDTHRGLCYSFQKDYTRWKRVPKQAKGIRTDTYEGINTDNNYPCPKDKRKKKEYNTTQNTSNSPREKTRKAKIEHTPNGKVIYPPLFEKFWKYYPRKKEKIPTLEIWLRLEREKEDMDDVVKSAENYRDEHLHLGTAENYIKLPTSFLRKDRWRDYLVSQEDQQKEALRQELELKEVRQ